MWKRALSYLMAWHIETVESDINTFLKVTLLRGQYQLCSANAIYSYGLRYDNFVKAFERVRVLERPVEEVLVLGLGLGSVPLILEDMGAAYAYTAVEIDEAVIHLASKYTLPQLTSPLELHCADAFAYVMRQSREFDLICMDVFLDDKVPQDFESAALLGGLRDLLAPGGLLMYNRLAATPADVAATKRFYEEHFLPVFPEGSYLDVGGNWMLLSSAAAAAISFQ